MAKKLEEGDEERDRYFEVLAKFQRLAHGMRPPSCVTILERPLEEIGKHLGLEIRGLVNFMYEHLKNGGIVERVDEERGNWKHLWKFHFDLRPDFGGKPIYVETRFVDDEEPDDREIKVVSVHPPDDVTWSRWNK